MHLFIDYFFATTIEFLSTIQSLKPRQHSPYLTSKNQENETKNHTKYLNLQIVCLCLDSILKLKKKKRVTKAYLK